jgi:hypothetical protein
MPFLPVVQPSGCRRLPKFANAFLNSRAHLGRTIPIVGNRLGPASRGRPGIRSRSTGAHRVTEPQQLALDPAMPPGRVLPGQPDHQVADLSVDRRPTPPVRPPLARQQPRQRGEHRTIRPRQPRRADLAAQHGYLMPQRHDLDVLRGVGSGQQRQPAHNPRQPRYSIRTATARDHAVRAVRQTPRSPALYGLLARYRPARRRA